MRAALLFTILLAAPALAQSDAPGNLWQWYATPEEAGFDSAKLEAAKQHAKASGSAAFVLVYRGKIVASYGDISRRYMCHSVRKSFLSGAFGLHDIDTSKTLAELGIDDVGKLTATEKRATIKDLLCARSGVYHPAAYETESMKRNRPKRGSHEPGTHWWYNNWDFNALLTIFEKETGTKFFEEFAAKIAGPIGMEDLRPIDTYYHKEPENSQHPAYPFRMSARDMARYGLLFLRKGEWNGKRILPAAWIEESTKAHTKFTERGGGGYGYMWWRVGAPFDKVGAYAARGAGGQWICVVPGLDIVFVHRADTYRDKNVSTPDRLALLRKCVQARTGEPKPEPKLKGMVDVPTRDEYRLSRAEVANVVGSYKSIAFPDLVIEQRGEDLVAKTFGGTFRLFPREQGGFWVEDVEAPLYIHRDKLGRETIVFELMNALEMAMAADAGKPKQALGLLQLALGYFPKSTRLHTIAGLAAMDSGDIEAAAASFKKALDLDPDNARAKRMLERVSK